MGNGQLPRDEPPAWDLPASLAEETIALFVDEEEIDVAHDALLLAHAVSTCVLALLQRAIFFLVALGFALLFLPNSLKQVAFVAVLLSLREHPSNILCNTPVAHRQVETKWWSLFYIHGTARHASGDLVGGCAALEQVFCFVLVRHLYAKDFPFSFFSFPARHPLK